MQIRKGFAALCAGLALAAGSFPVGAQAQEKAPPKQEPRERRLIVEQERIQIEPGAVVADEHTPPGLPRIPGGDTFVFLSTEMSINGKTVKGAPYSAEAVTEFTQTLADGNRIVRKNSANVYRDSEGRTRREQTLRAIGPFAAAGDPPQTIFINDPVAKVNYILDPRTHTARKLPSIALLPPPPPGHSPKAPAPGERHEARVRIMPPPPGAGPQGPPPAGRTVIIDEDLDSDVDNDVTPAVSAEASATNFEMRLPKPQKESLGKRTIEGVEAEGTRVTHTIAAGEIGNEQPINIVHETWYSPELQTIVYSKHTDPRAGETVYRLSNINRSEPARSLFEVPADYTVKEGPAGRTFFRSSGAKNDR